MPFKINTATEFVNQESAWPSSPWGYIWISDTLLEEHLNSLHTLLLREECGFFCFPGPLPHLPMARTVWHSYRQRRRFCHYHLAPRILWKMRIQTALQPSPILPAKGASGIESRAGEAGSSWRAVLLLQFSQGLRARSCKITLYTHYLEVLSMVYTKISDIKLLGKKYLYSVWG